MKHLFSSQCHAAIAASSLDKLTQLYMGCEGRKPKLIGRRGLFVKQKNQAFLSLSSPLRTVGNEKLEIREINLQMLQPVVSSL